MVFLVPFLDAGETCEDKRAEYWRLFARPSANFCAFTLIRSDSFWALFVFLCLGLTALAAAEPAPAATHTTVRGAVV